VHFAAPYYNHFLNFNTLATIDNSKTLTKDAQTSISPVDSLDVLIDGNKRFLDHKGLERNFADQISKTSKGQFPHAAILSCIDSRIPTEIIFDQGIGDIFNARVAGNFINEDILGSLEFACKVAGSKLILVLGHTSCGAVKGACDNVELGNLTSMLAKIKPAIEQTEVHDGEDTSSKNLDYVNRVSHQNVVHAISEIKKHSPVLNDMLTNNEIDIKGGMYDVKSGEVTIIV